MPRIALVIALTLLPALVSAKGEEQAVSAALTWIARHQSQDGSWGPSQWSGTCTKGRCAGPGRSEHGDRRYVVGLTGLAIQAFVGSKHTHQDGTHKAVVAKALEFLLKKQKADGSIGFSHGEEIYNHALATYALAELFGATKDETLRPAAQKAANWCVRAQNPSLGWMYGVRTGKNDTSVTGWMTQALAACSRAGLLVPPAVFEGAKRWFKRATDHNGKAGYQTPGSGSAFLAQNQKKYDRVPAMTAMSVHCRTLCGERVSVDGLRKGAKLVDASPPLWKPRLINGYYWLAGTRAMASVGGAKRKAWNEALSVALVGNQRAGACVEGSWDPVGEWCLAGGRVFFTAINALSLQAALNPPKGAAQAAGAPHGGELVLTTDHVFEVLLERDGVTVYVSDALGRPAALTGIKGAIRVSVYPLVRYHYKPRYKPKKGRKLSRKQQAKEAARRAKYDARYKEKSKPLVTEHDVELVGPDPAVGRRVGHLQIKVRVSGRFKSVHVNLDLTGVPGSKTRVTRVGARFGAISERVRYQCAPCKQKHEDPGPCVKCSKPVK